MIKTVNINNIKIRLFNENKIIIPYKIENTPHFKALNGDTIVALNRMSALVTRIDRILEDNNEKQ